MNTTYRKNLKDAMTACKNYTDKKIDDLKWELGSHTLDVESDTDVAYSKTVPSGTIGCTLDKIGGMSYKSENLLIITTNSYVSRGINATLNKGIISINGTASSSGYAEFVFNINSVSLNGDYYWTSFLNFSGNFALRAGTSNLIINGFNTVGKAVSNITGTATNFVIGFNVTADTNYSYTVKPMLVNGTTAPTTFKQGFTGIRDSAVTSVVSEGANLLGEDIEQGGFNADGTKANYTSRVRNVNYFSLPAGTYTLVAFANVSVKLVFSAFNSSNAKILDTGAVTNPKTFTLTENATKCCVQVASYDLSSNLTPSDVTGVMIVKGSTAPTEFKPYIQPITKQIPAEVQALEGYGKIYSILDLNNKNFIPSIEHNLGNDTYYSGSSGIFSVILNDKANNKNVFLTTSKYKEVVDYSTMLNTDMSYYNGGTNNENIYFHDSNYNDTTTFKNSMNNVFVYYPPLNPNEIGLSQYFTDDWNKVQVEPNGTIIFDNTYNQAVPSEIDYLIEEVKP